MNPQYTQGPQKPVEVHGLVQLSEVPVSCLCCCVYHLCWALQHVDTEVFKPRALIIFQGPFQTLGSFGMYVYIYIYTHTPEPAFLGTRKKRYRFPLVPKEARRKASKLLRVLNVRLFADLCARVAHICAHFALAFLRSFQRPGI